MNQFIYWEDDANETYLYGSHLTFEGKTVQFANALMPPGTNVKSWRSQTNYQADRIQPSLPLLKQGQDYELKLLAQAQPAQTLYLKVSYFDQLGKALGFSLLRPGEEAFTYPEEAFSYQIDLVNGGCHSFKFEALVITDQDQPRLTFKNEILYRQGGDQLHVIFLEDPFQPDQEAHPILTEIGDVILVADAKALVHNYMAADFSKELEKRLAAYCQAYQEIAFIGFGPVGNLAALYYHDRHAGSKAYVTAETYPLETYDLAVEAIGSLPQAAILALLELPGQDDKVTLYGDTVVPQGTALSLVLPLICRLDRLADLPFLNEMWNQ